MSWLSSAQPGFLLRSHTNAPSIRRRWQPKDAQVNDFTDGRKQLRTIKDRCNHVVPNVSALLESDIECPTPSSYPEADEGATCMCPYDGTSPREAIYDKGESNATFSWNRPYGTQPPATRSIKSRHDMLGSYHQFAGHSLQNTANQLRNLAAVSPD